MPRTPEQYEEIRNEKKQLISTIALKLFANHGYTETSISRIAEEANMSKGLMYNYFSSKEELLIYLLNMLADEFTRDIDPNKDNIVTEEEAIHYIDALFDLLKNKREQLRYIYQLGFQPEVVKIVRRPGVIREDIMKPTYLLLDFFASRLPKINPKIATTNILSIMKGFPMIYVYTPENYPDEFMEEYKTYIKQFISNQNK